MNCPIGVIMEEEGITKQKLIVIYKITSPSNKIYIGQSIDWISRKSKYKKLKCKGQFKIYRSLIKYGYNNHIIEIIENFPIDISQENLNERETYWWKYYKDLGFEMLNIKEPGSNGKASNETKKKMSIAHSGKNNVMFGKFGKDHPAFGNIGYWKGKKGKEASRYGTTGILNPNYGRTGNKHPMFGLTKEKSPFAKKVINIETKEIYLSAKNAAEILNLNYTSLTAYLRRSKPNSGFKNKYSLTYVNN